MKRVFVLLLAVSVLCCLGACDGNDMANTDDTSGNTYRSETDDTLENEMGTGETADIDSSTESMNDEETTNISEETGKPTEQTKSVFETENITRITFYMYYGLGKGGEVPNKYMTEITNWLGSFTIDERVQDDLLPPGTNTYYVEIEYSDGTVIKNGLSTIEVDGIVYYMEYDKEPECFWEILSQAKLTE